MNRFKSLTPIGALSVSVGAAAVTIGLKSAAWWTTGSVGFLSDALDSVTNFVAALFALAIVAYARRPPDDRFPYGYGKAEYFSSLAEGVLISLAALAILWAGWTHLFEPRPLTAVGLGTALTLTTVVINWGVASMLIRVGRTHRSLATESDGRHLMSDVYMTLGVIVGVGGAALSGWRWVDSIVAIIVALNLFRQSIRVMGRSLSGLMDGAFDAGDIRRVKEGLRSLERDGGRFTGLRTRRAGANRFAFVELHVPTEWTVGQADQIAHRAERAAAEHGIRLMVRMVPAAQVETIS